MKHTKKIADQTTVVSLLEMPTGGASDMALKKNIIEIATALEHILALRPVTWQWKSGANVHERQRGFIAQEVEEVFPELVATVTSAKGVTHKSLSTKELIPYFVTAIKELQLQIDTLKAEVEKQKSKNS